MVSKKKNIVVSIIGLVLFAIGMGLFIFSFTFQRSSIIFVNDDGTVIKDVPTAVGKSRSFEEDPVSNKNDEIPLGYEARFIGWEVPGIDEPVRVVEMKEEKDLTVTARYEIIKSVYSIDYYAYNAVFSAEENKKKVISFDIDTKPFDLPQPRHKTSTNGQNNYGYSFAGWDIMDTKDVEEKLFSIDPKVNNMSCKLVAKWEINDYKITFDPATYQLVKNEYYYGYSSKIGLKSLPTPQKAGYTFLGWYDNEALNGAPITSIPKGTTGNISLFPKWELNTYSISYDLAGGTFVSSLVVEQFTIQTEKFALPTVVKEGYVFKGWDNVDTPTIENITEIENEAGNLVLIAVFEEEADS